jgi:hypothetical protein
MFDAAVQDVRDSLYPPMGMPGETREVVARIVGMEVVEKKERIELRDLIVAEGALEMNAGPFDRRFALPDLTYSSCHGESPPYDWLS